LPDSNHISSAYGSGKFGLSFELFPPKTPAGEEALARHVERLVEFTPSYITCTYGAGGSTQSKTLDIIAAVRDRHGLPVATHLTCVGRTVEQIADFLRTAVERGITNVVALRGDPPKGSSEFAAIEGGFRYANELVAFIRGRFASMGIAVGGYPEIHQEATCPDTDLANLKRKVDAGADVIITQLFYSNDDYWRFCDRCQAAGINVPIVPGLLPVTNFAQIQRISSLCGATIPASFCNALESAGNDPEAQFAVGVDQATRQLAELLEAGVPGVHLYVLNKSEAASEVLRAVSLPRPQ
jgi:methylenetetrahydrofolate reductase (NADPH)